VGVNKMHDLFYSSCGYMCTGAEPEFEYRGGERRR
jgi:hypothetical protein